MGIGPFFRTAGAKPPKFPAAAGPEAAAALLRGPEAV